DGAAQLNADVLWRCVLPDDTAEIGAFDAQTARVFATGINGVNVVHAATGARVGAIECAPGTSATSVACHDGVVAVAWAAVDRTQHGWIEFYAAATCEPLARCPAGHNPDMLAFTRDGRRLASANEGEPTDDYQTDPVGSITVVDLPSDGDWSHVVVRQINFDEFNDQRDELRAQGVRIFAPSVSHPDSQATVAEDLEPEYLALSDDGDHAWVTLQENNAIAELDLAAGRVTAIHPLGLKRFCATSAVAGGVRRNRVELVGLDVSDQDGGFRLRDLPVFGLYDPDAVVEVQHDGATYLLTANEGDARKYPGFTEQCRVGELATHQHPVDPQLDAQIPADQHGHLDRLMVSEHAGDLDGDGDIDQLCTFGGRSFSVWRVSPGGQLELAFDSGCDFERILAETTPERFLHNGVDACIDDRSPFSGPEPEGLVVGQVGSRRLAFISLERASGVMIYDVTNVESPEFCRYLPPHVDEQGCDIAPEGLIFIAPADSPAGQATLVVCNEVSGTLTAYALTLGQQ
ncbi:MAG: choice-of-anchor I family protein, partial [Planctomycetales bacterium]|nr:choice-of-anchor I family protein [Planctomycetales bacterium]